MFTRLFFFFYLWMKFHPCLFDRDELIRGWNFISAKKHVNSKRQGWFHSRKSFIPEWNFTCKNPLNVDTLSLKISSKCALSQKPGHYSFTIYNKKSKKIPHTIFETLVKKTWYKIQKGFMVGSLSYRQRQQLFTTTLLKSVLLESENESS